MTSSPFMHDNSDDDSDGDDAWVRNFSKIVKLL
jgi:hypothetical protein